MLQALPQDALLLSLSPQNENDDGGRKQGRGACSQQPPPRRFVAGTDAIATAEQKVADLKAQIDAGRNLSTSLDFDWGT